MTTLPSRASVELFHDQGVAIMDPGSLQRITLGAHQERRCPVFD
jgi:hypothetical protein